MEKRHEKVVVCYRCKTQHMLDENCPVDTPTGRYIPEDSGMSFNGQSGTPRENLAPVQPESPAEILPSSGSQLNSSPTEEEACEGSSSMEETG